MHLDDKIYIAGHNGMVGSAIFRHLHQRGYRNILTRDHSTLDLTDQLATSEFFQQQRPDIVFLAAARVGGIQANNHYRAEFIYQNLAIQSNVIHSAWSNGTRRMIFLGSSCIYPRDCAQPMHEHDLLTGVLESTNEPYAIAKLAGLKMCQAYNAQYGTNYVSVMPTNLYGPGDNFNLENAHVLPALLRKAHEAVQAGQAALQVWGTGTALREFLYVEDMAQACVLLAENQAPGHDIFNIGSGMECTIRQLVDTIRTVTGHTGDVCYDTSAPDGTPRKLLHTARMDKLGWQAKTMLETGIEKTYQWFLVNQAIVRG